MILQHISSNYCSTLKTNINLAPIALMKQTNKKINIKIVKKYWMHKLVLDLLDVCDSDTHKLFLGLTLAIKWNFIIIILQTYTSIHIYASFI